MDLLLQLKNRGSVSDVTNIKSENNKTEENGLTMNAQTYIFFLAGFETSFTLVTFTLLEIARNLDIQKKLRRKKCSP